ncbi:MAG: SDR family NAD(P)-dependent oxidoreductase, partial [Deltaproteobacteria bacterium]|nr:SDR family NAD(P)-dependent oxidoreductase [Deltaproteobacteria bacterium]
MDFSLKNKVVLITGASRGIGKAAAIGLAQAGADVVLASRKLPDLE